jgi:hypothetical protein
MSWRYNAYSGRFWSRKGGWNRMKSGTTGRLVDTFAATFLSVEA